MVRTADPYRIHQAGLIGSGCWEGASILPTHNDRAKADQAQIFFFWALV